MRRNKYFPLCFSGQCQCMWFWAAVTFHGLHSMRRTIFMAVEKFPGEAALAVSAFSVQEPRASVKPSFSSSHQSCLSISRGRVCRKKWVQLCHDTAHLRHLNICLLSFRFFFIHLYHFPLSTPPRSSLSVCPPNSVFSFSSHFMQLSLREKGKKKML